MFDALARVMAFYITAIVVIAFTLGGLAVWGLPKLWHWLKPIIHQVTA